MKKEKGVPVHKSISQSDGRPGDCFISKVDNSKKPIDFLAIPEDVLKADLLAQGIRVCSLRKK